MVFDDGFGKDGFGEGQFGVQDVIKNLIWEFPIPREIKRDDAEQGHPLRETLLAVERPLEVAIEKVRGITRQVHPLFSSASKEMEVKLPVDKVESVGRKRTRIYIQKGENDEHFDALSDISVHTTDADKPRLNDGWNAVINGSEYRVVDKDALDMWVEIVYFGDVPDPLTFQPPDILREVAANYFIHYHEEDPVDWVRRAVYNQTLLRDWRYAGQYWPLLGRHYGFDLEVEPLFCISDDLCEPFKRNYPNETHEVPDGDGGTECFTEKFIGTVKYDAVPADVIPADTQTDFTIDTDILSATEADPDDYPQQVTPKNDTNFWVVEIDKEAWESMNDIENFYLIDADGAEHKIESNELAQSDVNLSDSIENEITLLAEDVATGQGQLLYKVDVYCSDDYKRAAAYWVNISSDEVLDRDDANTSRMIESIIQKVDRDVPHHIRVVAYNIQWMGMTSSLQSGSVDGELIVTS